MKNILKKLLTIWVIIVSVLHILMILIGALTDIYVADSVLSLLLIITPSSLVLLAIIAGFDDSKRNNKDEHK